MIDSDIPETTIRPVVAAPVVVLPHGAAALPVAPVTRQENPMADVSTTVPSAATHTIHSGANQAAGLGAGMGVGGLALGGVAGLVLGSMLGNRGGGLFGGNNNGNGAEAVVTLEALEAIHDAEVSALASANVTQTAIAASNLATLQATNQLGASLQGSATQQLITNLQGLNQVQMASQVGFASQNLLSQQGFAALATATATAAVDIKNALAAQSLRAEAIASAAALANQECCCAIKGAIRDSTDAILGNLTSTRIQDLQIENSNLRQTQTLTALLAERGHDHVVRTH